MSARSEVEVLNDCEEELVGELSEAEVNAVELSKKLFQACIITNDMCDHFTSLDHSRVDTQLQIRYLLRLVRENIKSDATVWDKFLILLDTLRGISNMEKLKKLVSNTTKGLTEVSEVNRASDTVGGCVSEDEDIFLNHDDVGLLTELLVPISHEWEGISISLGFQQHDIENFRKDDNRISLNKTIACWISRDSKSTLKKLTRTLSSNLVGAGRVAQELEKKFKNVKKQSENVKKGEPTKTVNHSSLTDTDFTLTISNMSYHTEVADGKSTLLLVQASPRQSVSYQWKKDGQPLANSSTYCGVHDEILVVRYASQGTEGKYTCCVSKEGKEVCSNKITLTVVYALAKKRLLNLYSKISEIPENSWPPVVSRKFINLALIKSSDNCTDPHDYSVRGDADDIIAEKERVEYEEVFDEYKSGELTLVEGRPGSGKTTLLHKVIKDWARGEVLTKSKLVYLVTLRSLNYDGRDEALSDLLGLFYFNEEELITVRGNIDANDGEGVCFLIDGLDEYQPQNKKKSVIYKLLDKSYLPQAMIILSSRPAAITTLKKDVLTKQIEVFGFSKQQIFEYIDCFPFGSVSSLSSSTNSIPATLKEYLVSNPNIFDMCYLPVHAAMICFLFKFDKEHVSCTQTKIYEQFTRLIIQRHLTRHHVDTKFHSLKELRGIYKEYFDDLCHLAFTMTINSKQVISQQELGFQLAPWISHGDEVSLGLVTIYRTIHLTGLHHNYTFLHLTFQEFLAAYYIANLDTCQQMKIIEQYSNTKHMFVVWIFYCGLVNFQSGLTRFKKLIHGSKDFWNKEVVRYGYESQQQSVCDELVKQLNGSLNFYKILTPTEIQAIKYIITTTTQPVSEISLRHSLYDDDRITILIDQLSQMNLQRLGTLNIYSPMHGNENNMFVNVLKSATNLRRLRLNIKDISSDDTKCFIDQMKHLTSLKYLDLYFSAPPNSINVLLTGLSFLTKIHSLNLSLEDVDTENPLTLGSRLCLHITTNLHTLDLAVTGLENGLQHFTTLCQLHQSHNNTECDDGNNLFQCLISLRELNLSRNNICADDIDSLASSLRHLTTLENLDLSHNKFDLGVSHLIIGLKCLTNIKTLHLDHNTITFELGASYIFSGLLCHTNLRTLDLSHNNISSDGATSLACTLKYLNNLVYLYLSHNHIGREGMTSLSSKLVCLTKLYNLNLSQNQIDLRVSQLVELQYLRTLDLSLNNITFATLI